MKREETQVTPLVTPPVTLHVTEYGDRAAAVHLLLVHGFPDDQRMWEPVVEALPPDWHVITYDVRGSGRSSKPSGRASYRTSLLVEDLIAVLDATLPTGAQVHLVAHDWGSVAGWDVLAAETWDPRLEGRIASYTSASGPSLDHLGSLASTLARPAADAAAARCTAGTSGCSRCRGCPSGCGGTSSGCSVRSIGRLDPTSEGAALGPRASGTNTRHSIDLYRANVLPRLREPLPWRTSIPVQVLVATPRLLGDPARGERVSRRAAAT